MCMSGCALLIIVRYAYVPYYSHFSFAILDCSVSRALCGRIIQNKSYSPHLLRVFIFAIEAYTGYSCCHYANSRTVRIYCKKRAFNVSPLCGLAWSTDFPGKIFFQFYYLPIPGMG